MARHGTLLGLYSCTSINETMNYLTIGIISIVILAILVTTLLLNSQTGRSFRLQGRQLTLLYPLKKEVVKLDTEVKSWNIERIHLMWRGKLYALSLELKNGTWKKLYFRSRTEEVRHLVAALDEVAPLGKA